MIELTDEEFEAAEERGRIAMVTEPRAASARYDARTQRIIVELVSDCTFIFPPRILQGMENATDAELAEVDTGPFGFGLHWETLDADFTVAGLLAGRFGTAKFMERLRTEQLRELREADRRSA